jgi:signal transduction histidine kinase
MSGLRELTDAYTAALKAYLEGHGEAALLEAYEMGRAALAAKLTVLEVSAIHQVALVRTLLERLPESEQRRLAKAAAELSSESFLPFELTVQGAREANTILQDLNNTLASKNAEIQRQVEELRVLQQLKDDLMSLIVHDLRNPLSGMLSCLDLLKPRPGDANYESTLEIVTLAREGARKLGELIDDLLEARKLEEGKVQIAREQVRVAEIVHEAVSTHASTARLEGMTLDVRIEDSALVIQGDRRLLRRAVENLVSNALKFSRSGETVAIVARTSPEGVAIEVLDRGPGVAQELRGRLFEKFGSSDAKSRGGRRGYGLGLYFVKLVATAHDGSVAAETRDGGGSLFRLLLPREVKPTA